MPTTHLIQNSRNNVGFNIHFLEHSLGFLGNQVVVGQWQCDYHNPDSWRRQIILVNHEIQIIINNSESCIFMHFWREGVFMCLHTVCNDTFIHSLVFLAMLHSDVCRAWTHCTVRTMIPGMWL